METAPTVLLISNRSDESDGLEKLIEAVSPARVIARAPQQKNLMDLVRMHEPDLLVLDLRGSADGIVGQVEAISGQLPSMGMIVISDHPDPRLAARVIRAGGTAYLAQESEDTELADAITSAAQGRTFVGASILDGIVSEYITIRSEKGPRRRKTCKW